MPYREGTVTSVQLLGFIEWIHSVVVFSRGDDQGLEEVVGE